MAIFKVQKNDLVSLSLTAIDADGNTIDITGSTLTFRMKKEGTATHKVSGSCVIVSGSAGTCTYTPSSGDFDTEGIYKGEVEVVSGSTITTGVNIEVRVGGEIG